MKNRPLTSAQQADIDITPMMDVVMIKWNAFILTFQPFYFCSDQGDNKQI